MNYVSPTMQSGSSLLLYMVVGNKYQCWLIVVMFAGGVMTNHSPTLNHSLTQSVITCNWVLTGLTSTPCNHNVYFCSFEDNNTNCDLLTHFSLLKPHSYSALLH